jgi:hypothetical protein
MPSETRTIVFDNADIKEALVCYCREAKKAEPAGGVGRLTISNDEGISIQVFAKESGDAVVSFDEKEVIVALIDHCRSYKIPVPQKARKSVVIYAGSIGLQIDIS